MIVVRWGVEKLFEFVQHKFTNVDGDNSNDLEINHFLLDLIGNDLLQVTLLHLKKTYKKYFDQFFFLPTNIFHY